MAAGAGYVAAPSFAADPVFEIDGGAAGANFVVNTAGNLDWESVLTGPVANDNSPAETTVFKTSSKENSAVSTWRDGNDSAPPKTDIRELYRWSRLTEANEIEFFFGWERAKPQGTLFYTLELNRKPNIPGVGGGSDFTVPNRTAGDHRFSLFDQGSGTIELRQIDVWTGTAWDCTNGAVAGCDAPVDLNAFQGRVNLANTTWPAAWGGKAVPADTFVEVAFNLTDLIGTTPGCPGLSGFINFRSSTGATSSSTGENLKDYIKPIAVDGPTTCADDLTVSKTVNPVFTRAWTWSIVKDFDANYDMEPGESVNHAYEVRVSPTSADSAWALGGQITVSNPNDNAFTGVAVTDAVTNGGTCSVTGGTNATVPANGDLVLNYSCTYAAAPSSASGVNTIQVAWDPDANGSSGSSASASVNFAFANPTTETGKQITVDDDNLVGETWNANGAVATFNYSKQFTCPTDTALYTNGLHQFTHVNTATIVQTQQSDIATVNVTCRIPPPPPPPPGATLLIIDEDSVDNGIHYARGTARITPSGPSFFTRREVNDDKPGHTQRDVLRFFEKASNIGTQVTVRTGQTGDEGWFAPTCIPQKWLSGSSDTCLTGDARETAIDSYFGLGTVPPQSALDKIPAVMPLRALGLNSLVGQTVCAVVYDSDIGINYDSDSFPFTTGNLQGETLGVAAFRVDETTTLSGFSSSTLPQVTITVLDPSVCGNWKLFNAPVPTSSSEPNDVEAPGSPSGYRALATWPGEALFF
jgi:hypothetical protein